MGIPSSPLYLINNKSPVPDSTKSPVPDSPKSPVLNPPKFPGLNVHNHLRHVSTRCLVWVDDCTITQKTQERVADW